MYQIGQINCMYTTTIDTSSSLKHVIFLTIQSGCTATETYQVHDLNEARSDIVHGALVHVLHL